MNMQQLELVIGEMMKDVEQNTSGADKARLYDLLQQLIQIVGSNHLCKSRQAEVNQATTIASSCFTEGDSFEAELVNMLLIINHFNFTARELDCIKFTMSGLSAKEIARKLDISYRTVELHLEHIKRKLKCNSKLEMIAKLIKFYYQNKGN